MASGRPPKGCDVNGLASFELLEGPYGYRVERSGAVGGKVGFVVSSGVNQLLTYHLATLTV